ncbi:hypothetical protein PsorP6_009011 [Peronosclerospora sorghi]|uniref:Uncharacterized protein n=1 Tax=Peronosclerospora sorghi TaxID=230839 RepID=A0ACC0W053_9STRA|nr:hypothetical protein PsorP6_009011 [Peronosclerospora sorghi]
MTEIAAYHAIPEQDKSDHWIRPTPELSSEKVSITRKPIPSGSTEEALMDIHDYMEASLRVNTAIMPRN